jgi:hypothetical protein
MSESPKLYFLVAGIYHRIRATRTDHCLTSGSNRTTESTREKNSADRYLSLFSDLASPPFIVLKGEVGALEDPQALVFEKEFNDLLWGGKDMRSLAFLPWIGHRQLRNAKAHPTVAGSMDRNDTFFAGTACPPSIAT